MYPTTKSSMKEIILRIQDEERNLKKAKQFLVQQRHFLESDTITGVSVRFIIPLHKNLSFCRNVSIKCKICLNQSVPCLKTCLFD